MPYPRTRHAERRLQQRAIPPFVLDLLETCGSPRRCQGAERLIFDKAAHRRLRHVLGHGRGLCLIEPWLDVYAVVGADGTIVTVAHHTRHIRRD